MLEAIRDFIRGRRVIPAAPATFIPKVPEVDLEEFDEVEDYEPDLDSVAGVGCIITYRDSKGDESFRRITCRKLSRKGAATYLQAYCHERETLRTFRVDRVTEVACGESGEVYASVADFFSRYAVADDGGAAVGFGLNVRLASDLRAGLNVLAFLARADGRVVPEEEEVMSAFCQSFGVRYGTDAFDHRGVCQYARCLAPDAETFFVSIHRLKRQGAPEGLSRLVLQSAGSLIDADGVQHEQEFYFGSKLREYLLN